MGVDATLCLFTWSEGAAETTLRSFFYVCELRLGLRLITGTVHTGSSRKEALGAEKSGDHEARSPFFIPDPSIPLSVGGQWPVTTQLPLMSWGLSPCADDRPGPGEKKGLLGAHSRQCRAGP